MHCPFSTSHLPLTSTALLSAHASSATIDRLSKYDGMISTSAAAIASKQRLEDREANRFVALGRGHEHRARRRRSGAVIRVVVPVAEEEEVIVLGRAPRDELDQRPARWTFRINPRELVPNRMALLEHVLRSTAEPVGIALPLHAKPPHRHARDRLHAGGALAAPRLAGG